jgi:hypothetical protein
MRIKSWNIFNEIITNQAVNDLFNANREKEYLYMYVDSSKYNL